MAETNEYYLLSKVESDCLLMGYDLAEVKRLKKLLIAQEGYWDQKLPVEFCIAIRTRDILLGRKIVDDFTSSKRNAEEKAIFDFELENIWQEYFKTYVTDEGKIGEFWALFIKPSREFSKQYSELDKIFFPKLLEAKKSGHFNDELKYGFHELLNLFRQYRHQEFWENERDWEWFFVQFLKFLTNNHSEQVCRDGLGNFINIIIKMDSIIQNAGWKIDYGLYDNPLNVWGGQSLKSKLRARKKAKGFAKRARLKLGWRAWGTERRNYTNFIFTYLASIPYMISMSLFLILFIDTILTALVFIINGYWASVVQSSFILLLERFDLFRPEVWKINTGLVGFDYLTNQFIALQYSVSGRWKMLGFALLLSSICLIFSLIFNLEFKDKSSNPRTRDDVSVPFLLGNLTSLGLLIPLVFGACLIGILYFFGKLFGYSLS